MKYQFQTSSDSASSSTSRCSSAARWPLVSGEGIGINDRRSKIKDQRSDKRDQRLKVNDRRPTIIRDQIPNAKDRPSQASFPPPPPPLARSSASLMLCALRSRRACPPQRSGMHAGLLQFIRIFPKLISPNRTALWETVKMCREGKPVGIVD